VAPSPPSSFEIHSVLGADVLVRWDYHGGHPGLDCSVPYNDGPISVETVGDRENFFLTFATANRTMKVAAKCRRGG